MSMMLTGLIDLDAPNEAELREGRPAPSPR